MRKMAAVVTLLLACSVGLGATHTWNGAVPGTFSAGSWDTAPLSAADTIITLTTGATATLGTSIDQDTGSPFTLNRLNLSRNGFSLTGGQLVFAANGATNPMIYVNPGASGTGLIVGNALQLDADLTVWHNGAYAGSTTFDGVVSGAGGLNIVQSSNASSKSLYLNARNTFTGDILVGNPVAVTNGNVSSSYLYAVNHSDGSALGDAGGSMVFRSGGMILSSNVAGVLADAYIAQKGQLTADNSAPRIVLDSQSNANAVAVKFASLNRVNNGAFVFGYRSGTSDTHAKVLLTDAPIVAGTTDLMPAWVTVATSLTGGQADTFHFARYSAQNGIVATTYDDVLPTGSDNTTATVELTDFSAPFDGTYSAFGLRVGNNIGGTSNTIDGAGTIKLAGGVVAAAVTTNINPTLDFGANTAYFTTGWLNTGGGQTINVNSLVARNGISMSGSGGSTVKLGAGAHDIAGDLAILNGTLNINGNDLSVGRLGGLGTITDGRTSGTRSTLTSTSASGQDTSVGVLTGYMNLVKNGDGALRIINAATYTGVTTVNAGLLERPGYGTAGVGAITIEKGATLRTVFSSSQVPAITLNGGTLDLDFITNNATFGSSFALTVNKPADGSETPSMLVYPNSTYGLNIGSSAGTVTLAGDGTLRVAPTANKIVMLNSAANVTGFTGWIDIAGGSLTANGSVAAGWLAANYNLSGGGLNTSSGANTLNGTLAGNSASMSVGFAWQVVNQHQYVGATGRVSPGDFDQYGAIGTLRQNAGSSSLYFNAGGALVADVGALVGTTPEADQFLAAKTTTFNADSKVQVRLVRGQEDITLDSTGLKIFETGINTGNLVDSGMIKEFVTAQGTVAASIDGWTTMPTIAVTTGSKGKIFVKDGQYYAAKGTLTGSATATRVLAGSAGTINLDYTVGNYRADQPAYATLDNYAIAGAGFTAVTGTGLAGGATEVKTVAFNAAGLTPGVYQPTLTAQTSVDALATGAGITVVGAANASLASASDSDASSVDFGSVAKDAAATATFDVWNFAGSIDPALVSGMRFLNAELVSGDNIFTFDATDLGSLLTAGDNAAFGVSMSTLNAGTFAAEYMLTFGNEADLGGASNSITLSLAGIVTGATVKMGDADGDTFVDDDDLSLLLSNWKGGNVGWGKGDFNASGDVDDDDLSLLLSNWTGSGGGTIPEPATIGLLILGGIGLIRRRA